MTADLTLKNKEFSLLRRMIRSAPGVLAGFVSTLLVFTPALATHEMDHRFTVWGEVLGSDGQPVSGETIIFTVTGDTPIGSVVTDDRGRYRVVLHVHDQDLGKVFDMIVRGTRTTVEIQFDPADTTTERGRRVDFTVGK